MAGANSHDDRVRGIRVAKLLMATSGAETLHPNMLVVPQRSRQGVGRLHRCLADVLEKLAI